MNYILHHYSLLLNTALRCLQRQIHPAKGEVVFESSKSLVSKSSYTYIIKVFLFLAKVEIILVI